MSLATVSLRRNLTRFELALMVAVIATLMAVFMRWVQRAEAEMDRVMLELTVRDMRNRLMIYQTEKLVSGTFGRLAELAGRNPFGLWMEPPANYAGELDGDFPDRVKPGQWYFDRSGGRLVYRVRNDRYLKTDLPGPGRVRFRVEPRFTDNNGDGKYEPGVDRLEGVSLRTLEPYQWLESATP